MKKRLNFAIIGCGSIANWHVQAINQIEGAVCIGATSRSQKTRSEFCLKYKIKEYLTYDELLNDIEVDVVCICTPSGLHEDMIVKAADAKKHIVVEKPMALTQKGCDRIIDACKDNNVKLQVAYQSRFSLPFIQVKEAIDNGDLGKLVYGDVYMKFFRNKEYYLTSNWKGTWAMDGGGALMNQGSHGIDILLYLMGNVKNVYGNSRTILHDIEVDDTTAAVLEYENGAIGVIQASTSVYPGIPRVINIHGTKGSIEIEEDIITKWDIQDKDMPKDVKIGSNDDFSAADPTAFSIEGHVSVIENMCESIWGNIEPLVNPKKAKKSIDLICGIYESSQKRKRIDIKMGDNE